MEIKIRYFTVDKKKGGRFEALETNIRIHVTHVEARFYKILAYDERI